MSVTAVVFLSTGEKKTTEVTPPAGAAAPESGPFMPAYYLVKWITWKEKKTPIITQSENGPCPLLAIMNTLFLRWKVKVWWMLSSTPLQHKHLRLIWLQSLPNIQHVHAGPKAQTHVLQSLPENLLGVLSPGGDLMFSVCAVMLATVSSASHGPSLTKQAEARFTESSSTTTGC